MSQLRVVLTYDEALLLYVKRWRAPWCTRIMQTLTHLGDTRSWVMMGLLLLAVGSDDTVRLALRLAAGAVIATVLVQPLKRWLRRPRPSRGCVGFCALAEDPDAFSFPSGHTAAAFGVAVACLGLGVGVGPLTLVMALAIGISRVYLGAHYPLDVAVGAVLGCIAGALARSLVAWPVV